MRNDTAVRLAYLIDLARAQHGRLPSLNDLAQRLDVCPRTVRRDLAALDAAHVPFTRAGARTDE